MCQKCLWTDFSKLKLGITGTLLKFSWQSWNWGNLHTYLKSIQNSLPEVHSFSFHLHWLSCSIWRLHRFYLVRVDNMWRLIWSRILETTQWQSQRGIWNRFVWVPRFWLLFCFRSGICEFLLNSMGNTRIFLVLIGLYFFVL